MQGKIYVSECLVIVVESVKSDGLEREGQGQYFIDNFGRVLEDEGNTPS